MEQVRLSFVCTVEAQLPGPGCSASATEVEQEDEQAPCLADVAVDGGASASTSVEGASQTDSPEIKPQADPEAAVDGADDDAQPTLQRAPSERTPAQDAIIQLR